MKVIKLKLRWLKNLLIAIDQLFNAIFLGSPDETISSRLHRYGSRYGWVRVLENLVDGIFFLDYELRDEGKIKHCQLSYEMELTRGHLDPNFRTIWQMKNDNSTNDT